MAETNPIKIVGIIIISGILIGLMAMTGILSVSNGKLQAVNKKLAVRVVKLERAVKGHGYSMTGNRKLSGLTDRVTRLEGKVARQAKMASENATQHNRLIAEIKEIAQKASSVGGPEVDKFVTRLDQKLKASTIY